MSPKSKVGSLNVDSESRATLRVARLPFDFRLLPFNYPNTQNPTFVGAYADIRLLELPKI